MCIFPESNRLKFWSHSITDQNGPKGNPIKTNFNVFQIQKYEYHKQISKSRWKNGVICLVSFFPSQVMIFKLPKTVHFCKFVLTSPWNLNLKQFIYIYLKNSMFYRGLSNSSRDIENKVANEVKKQKFNEIQHLQTLISSKIYVIAK